MADDPLQQIQAFCETHEVRRLAAEEILELLADGEEPEWVAGQAADDRPDVAAQLTTLLAAIAPDVAPESDDEEDEDDSAEILTEAPPAEPTDEVPVETDEAPPVDAQAQLAYLAQHLPPGVDARQLQQMLSSPRGQMLADFGAFCEERGYQGDDESVMQAAHEEWLQTPRESLEGKKPADVLEGGRLLPGKVETFRREAPKVGRNDPCPCGSGKKYKKCHGKGG